MGISFWPELLGVTIAAFALGRVLRTRFLTLLPLAGMIVLIIASVVLAVLPDDGAWPLVLFITGLLGLGAGATCSWRRCSRLPCP